MEPREAEPAQSMPFHVEHLRPQTLGYDAVAWQGQAIEVPMDEAGRRSIWVVFTGQLDAQRFLYFFDWQPPISNDLVLTHVLHEDRLFIVFIVDLTHEKVAFLMGRLTLMR